MCSICNQALCPVLCPNYGENGLYQCRVCSDGICEGESYYRVGTSFFHKECLLDSYDKDQLLSLLGIIPRVVQGRGLSLLILGEKNDE